MAIVDAQDVFGGVQSTTATTATWALNTSVTVAAGSWIVIVCGMAASSARSLTSVSGGGLTWVVEVTTSNTRAVAIARAYAPAGLASGTALTMTWSGTTTNGKWAVGREVTGLGSGSTTDQTGTGSAGATTTPTVTTLAATESGAALISFAGFSQVATGATGTPSGSYVERGDVAFGTGGIRLGYAEARLMTGTGATETASVTSTVSGAYDSAIATFKAVAAATLSPPFPNPRRRRFLACIGR